MTEHAVVIQMWDGAITVEVTGEPPSQATLDQIAADYTPMNCGVRPNVRVLEQLTIPPFINDPEPVCEELLDGSAYGLGPIGPVGQQRASLGRQRR